jgi:hypothetical protein
MVRGEWCMRRWDSEPGQVLTHRRGKIDPVLLGLLKEQDAGERLANRPDFEHCFRAGWRGGSKVGVTIGGTVKQLVAVHDCQCQTRNCSLLLLRDIGVEICVGLREIEHGELAP